MKTFKRTAAQGDVYFEKIDELPEGAEKIETKGPELVVAHSETGHHHVMNSAKSDMYRRDKDEDFYLVVTEEDVLNHKRDFHTHESIQFNPGVYRVTHQREHVPGAAPRRVYD